MKDVIRKEIEKLTRKDISYFGQIIYQLTEDMVGKYGGIFVSKTLAKELKIDEDWANTTLHGDKIYLPFKWEENDDEEKVLEIRMIVADRTTAPIEDYFDDDVIKALYKKVEEIFKETNWK